MNGASENTKQRPPIVVVMGHVDHGKTTLLDYIRKSNVAAREAGGITQAIAAYEITHNGKRMTFIDTPGHEAFSRMRSRGAAAADLAILVVAAEEGVKPQTQEAINILNESKTPFVVAINKIDKPGANVERVKNELMTAGVLLEGYGGQVSYQPISAKAGDGVTDLLDLLLLAAEVENLTYDPSHPTKGFILEARLNQKRGQEVSLIVTDGILHQGDLISTETAGGKVKILEDFTGKPAKQIEPSGPALVVGFEKLPEVGQEFETGKAFAQAQNIPGSRLAPQNQLFQHEEENVNVILRALDTGSLEALSQIVRAMEFQKPVKIIQESVGEISDNDVQLAISSGALIIGFKSKVNKAAQILAESHKVKIITSQIIYELLTALEEFAKGESEELAGELEVLAVFSQDKLDKQLVGGKVLAGTIRNRANLEVRREGTTVASAHIASLRQQKKDVNEIGSGNEAGLLVSAGTQIKVGDHLVIKR
jgi:translation initiation factor IF-2